MQDIERRQLWCARNRIWNLLYVSDWNHANRPINCLKLYSEFRAERSDHKTFQHTKYVDFDLCHWSLEWICNHKYFQNDTDTKEKLHIFLLAAGFSRFLGGVVPFPGLLRARRVVNFSTRCSRWRIRKAVNIQDFSISARTRIRPGIELLSQIN